MGRQRPAAVRLKPVAAVCLVLGAFSAAAPAPSLPVFPLRTQGRWIVGADGRRVKLACVNWSGAEQADGVVAGLQHRRAADIAETFRSLGFNCVRLPWSVWMARTDRPVPEARREALLRANPELRSKSTLEILDAVVAACAEANLMVVLDNHISDGEWCCDDFDHNGVWYTSRWPESEWMAAHVALAKRYAGQPWVVGTELRNEVRNSLVNNVWRAPHWGGGGADDWLAAATRAGNAVLAVNPNLLIVVGGVSYSRDLTGIRWQQVWLQVPQRVVYSAHCYSWSYPATPATYEALKEVLDNDWGYIIEPNRPYTAPVWVSEFGTFNDCRGDSCTSWWPVFLRYLTEGDFDWAVWLGDGTNSRSSSVQHPFDQPTDYGILAADWQTPAGRGELLGSLRALQRPTSGPGLESACDQCEDTWNTAWPDGRRGSSACSACLHSAQCRNSLSEKDWCAQDWARAACGRTCCQAGLREAGTCQAGACKAYEDRWQPEVADQEASRNACLHCLWDPVCRRFQSEARWCQGSWARDRCERTCCAAGFITAEHRRLLVV